MDRQLAIEQKSNIRLHNTICCAKIGKKEEENMKRNDWILIGFICILTLFCFVGSFFVGKQEAGQVVVKVAGTLKGSYSLKEEQKIKENE